MGQPDGFHVVTVRRVTGSGMVCCDAKSLEWNGRRNRNLAVDHRIHHSQIHRDLDDTAACRSKRNRWHWLSVCGPTAFVIERYGPFFALHLFGLLRVLALCTLRPGDCSATVWRALIWRFAAVSLMLWRCLSHIVDRFISEKSCSTTLNPGFLGRLFLIVAIIAAVFGFEQREINPDWSRR